MSNVIQIAPSPESMTTRQIAEVTGKEHKHVVRDLKNTFEEVGIDLTRFGQVYIAGNGQQQTEYVLPKRECLLLTSRYSAKQRLAIIDRWIELETTPQLNIPTTFAEALRIAADQAEQIEQQQAQILEYAPKADALDRIATADGSLCITNAAKDLQMRPKDLFAWLNANDWIYRRAGNSSWTGHSAALKAGRVEHKVMTVTRTDGSEKVTEQVRITPKGLARLAGLLPTESA